MACSISATASPSLPPYQREAADPRLLQIESIFRKVQENRVLTCEEARFLQKEDIESRGIIGCCKSPRLALEKHRLSRVFAQVSPVVMSVEIERRLPMAVLSPAHLSWLAGCIEIYRKTQDPVVGALSDFRAQRGRDPTRIELIGLVYPYNKTPHLERAGQTVGQVGGFTIQYNAQGRLEILSGAIGPLDMAPHQTLTQSQIQEMKEVYWSLAKVPYNNLGEMLAFVQFYHAEKMREPSLSMREAWMRYKPDLEALYDRYRGGTCLLLAKKFQNAMAARGIQVECIGENGRNAITALPLPNIEKDLTYWEHYSLVIQHVNHAAVLCLYQDEDMKKSNLYFQCSYEQRSDEITKCDDSYLEAYYHKEEGIPNRIQDTSYIGKARLRGRWKSVIQQEGKILGIDLLRDNLYINSALIGDKRDLPLNSEGRVSISLADLANPDLRGEYWVNGALQEMTHREALQKVLVKAREGGMYLPEDTEDAILLLSQCRSEFFTNLFVEPLQGIKACYADLQDLAHRLNVKKQEVKKRVHLISKERYDLISVLEKSFEEMTAPFYFGRGLEDCRLAVETCKAQFDEIFTALERVD